MEIVYSSLKIDAELYIEALAQETEGVHEDLMRLINVLFFQANSFCL